MLVLRIIAAAFLFIFSLFSLYATSYFVWQTAAQSRQPYLEQAQFNTYMWFGLTIASTVLGILFLVFPRPKRVGKFEVLTPVSDN